MPAAGFAPVETIVEAEPAVTAAVDTLISWESNNSNLAAAFEVTHLLSIHHSTMHHSLALSHSLT